MHQEHFEALATVKDGKLTLADEPGYRAAMRRFADGDVVLTIEKARPRKSRRQEQGFHAMIMPWAREEGHAIEDLKRDLLREVFGLREHVNRLTGEVELVLREPHTSTLSRQQYSELIDRTLEIASGCGFVLIPPEEWKAKRQPQAEAAA